MLSRFSLILLLCLISGSAMANPVVLQLAGSVLLYVPGGQVLGWILIVAGTVWGVQQARQAQDEAERKAKQQYNDSLKERTATVISSEAPHVYVYGRARVGSAIVAVLTSGNKDQYKHLVCIHASHECDGIEEYYINGKALGALDVDGNVQVQGTAQGATTDATGYAIGSTSIGLASAGTGTIIAADKITFSGDDYQYTVVTGDSDVSNGGTIVLASPGLQKAISTTAVDITVLDRDYIKYNITSADEYFYASTTWSLAHTPITGSLRVIYTSSTSEGTYDLTEAYSLSGTTVTVADSRDYTCFYEYYETTPRVRIKTHLGAAGQVADATLIADVPGKWDSGRTLDGMCYSIVRIDLNQPDFQGGVPAVEVLMRGKKLHDPRDGAYPADTPVWSQNNALVIADYLTSEMCNVPYTDLPLDDYITAANVCDESTAYGNKYLCNGTVTAAQAQGQVLERMAQSMAGTICDVTFGITAGKYVAPVMSLTQADVVGDFNWVPGVAEADLFNGIKGQYISSENNYVPVDFAPYQNTTYVTADGDELWQNIDYIFTDTKQRVWNLCRIFVEDQRNAFTVKATFSFKCWGLKVGQRVTFTSAFLGQTDKVYRIIDKKFGLDQAVELTLKEDASSIWDLEDAVTVDSTPNSNLPSPFVVGLCGNLQVADDLYKTTGSAGVKAKAVCTWDAPADITVLDYDLQYKAEAGLTWLTIPKITSNIFEIFDLAPGLYDFRVRARNQFYATGNYTDILVKELYGLTAAPADITNFTLKKVSGVAVGSWDLSTDLDVRIGGRIVVRQSSLTSAATWNDGFVIEEFNGDAVSGIMDLITGTYMIKARDSSGNYSTNMISFVLTEGMITGFTTVGTSTQATGFTGTKTNLSVVGSVLQLTDPSASLTGDYLFDTYMDLTTSATRRFEADIGVYSFTVTDLIDSRVSLIDTWDMFDGAVINDCDVTLYAATTDDDPAGTPTWGDWTPFFVSDFTCRAIKFKLDFMSLDSTHNIAVTTLTVHAKIPA